MFTTSGLCFHRIASHLEWLFRSAIFTPDTWQLNFFLPLCNQFENWELKGAQKNALPLRHMCGLTNKKGSCNNGKRGPGWFQRHERWRNSFGKVIAYVNEFISPVLSSHRGSIEPHMPAWYCTFFWSVWKNVPVRRKNNNWWNKITPPVWKKRIQRYFLCVFYPQPKILLTSCIVCLVGEIFIRL